MKTIFLLMAQYEAHGHFLGMDVRDFFEHPDVKKLAAKGTTGESGCHW
ncbi:hypothetical protein [Variovorax paradoxus]|uniref:Uncharacterized protein n=1 Tax=Variovorax paradoxus TaxID=34073 RepID=A0A6I6HB33_VARPD|nr:hypothetical protein [Variovorax paradoxus]QGW82116.1 hypothetical protein GOQ09_11195 [Variovorax paradoxus]